MKKLKVVIIFLVIWKMSFPQTYTPFPDSVAAWGYNVRDDMGVMIENNKAILTPEDTVINAVTYRKMFIKPYSYPAYYAGALRQNIPLKKVYFIQTDSLTEKLLYDFDLQVGDTVPSSLLLPCYPYVYVTSIDSTNQYGGFFRKIFHLGGASSGDLIEGVGNSVSGILNTYCQITSFTFGFDCFSVNDTLLFWNGAPWTDCSTTAIENINSSKAGSLFPNPFSDNLTITLNKKEPVELTLYDLTSRKLLQQTFTTSTTINTSQLAKGIYIYEVRKDKGVVKQGKVVKK